MFTVAPPTSTVSAPADQADLQPRSDRRHELPLADALAAPGVGTCTDSNGAPGTAGALDTSTAGTHAYTVTARSADGQSTESTIGYIVRAAAVGDPAPPLAPERERHPIRRSLRRRRWHQDAGRLSKESAARGPHSLRGLRVDGTAIVWCHGDGCGYPPDTHLRFALDRATTVRSCATPQHSRSLAGVATAALQGHRGANRFLIAGRWHGELVPAGPVQIIVRLGHDQHWVTLRTISLTVRHAARRVSASARSTGACDARTSSAPCGGRHGRG